MGHKNKCFLVFFLIFSGISLSAQVPNRPFPQHTVYSDKCIKPSKHKQEELDKAVVDFYFQWKKAYLKNNCSDLSQYYVWNNENEGKYENNKSICVSEGQGYGMLIEVLMAGVDPDAQTIYNGMYAFYKSHHSKRSDCLMAWSVLKGCKTNVEKGGSYSSATDGDMDIALSLLMASQQWGDSGKINYKAEGIKMLEDILKYEINPHMNTVLLGDDNKPDDFDYNDIRCSDFMPAHLKTFNKFLPNGLWQKTIDNTYAVMLGVQKKYSPKTALFPDFIVYRNGHYQPAKANYLESDYDGEFYFNACRVPMRLAIDRLLNGDNRADTLQIMNDWIQAKTDNTIEKITCGYSLAGRKLEKDINTIPSFVCPMGVSAMIDSENQEWVDDLWDFTVEEFEFKDFRYYDNTLKMICMIVMSSNYWQP